jgi:hypothetical protein
MGAFLNQCCEDAWEVIRGRKKIVGRSITDFQDKEKSETQQEYGWLSPNGKFYPVEFGGHQSWASQYLLKEGDLKEEDPCAGDILIERGWILLHNPCLNNIQVTKSNKNYTKKQKDFLYDYFIKYGMGNKANEIIMEDMI